jgi:putative transposase
MKPDNSQPTLNSVDDLALLRFQIIAPLLCLPANVRLKDELGRMSSTLWTLPSGQVRRYAASTIEGWLITYRKGGLDALVSTPRSNRGTHLSVPESVRQQIDILLGKNHKLGTQNIIRQLRRQKKEGGPLAGVTLPSRSVLYRYVKKVRPQSDPSGGRIRSAFEAPTSNELWQADIMYGPKIPRKGSDGKMRKQQTYLIAILDDHSRLIVHGEYFFQQDLSRWFSVLRTAVIRRGLPAKLYCDNGKVFRSGHIIELCARLGIQLIFAPVRDGASKGKIERFWLNVQSAFEETEMTLGNAPRTLAKLNARFREWLHKYNHTITHSSTAQIPIARWLAASASIRYADSDTLDQHCFLFRMTRKVRKDRTFRYKNTYWETSSALCGKQITICYDPTRQHDLHVYHEGTYFGTASKLDKNENHKH